MRTKSQLKNDLLLHIRKVEAYGEFHAAEVSESMKKQGYDAAQIAHEISEQALWTEGSVLSMEVDILRLGETDKAS